MSVRRNAEEVLKRFEAAYFEGPPDLDIAAGLGLCRELLAERAEARAAALEEARASVEAATLGLTSNARKMVLSEYGRALAQRPTNTLFTSTPKEFAEAALRGAQAAYCEKCRGEAACVCPARGVL